MAEIVMSTCRECATPVSTEAARCPHCGVRDPTRSGASELDGLLGTPAENRRWLGRIIKWYIIGALVLAVLLAMALELAS